MAKRRGYRLVKSRSRDPQAVDYDLYAVIDVRTNAAVNPPIASMPLRASIKCVAPNVRLRSKRS